MSRRGYIPIVIMPPMNVLGRGTWMMMNSYLPQAHTVGAAGVGRMKKTVLVKRGNDGD